MFGIITKKDKKIAEQAARIEELERWLVMKPPTITETRHDVRTLRCSVVLQDGMPAEYAKRSIARKMVEGLEEVITYDFHDEEYNRVITGDLKVVV